MKKTKRNTEANLGGLFDSDDFDGLGFYGEHSPAWGALVGAGLTGAGILVAKHLRPTYPRLAKYAGLVGAAAGGIPSVAALFFPSTRRAGYLSLAVTGVIAATELIRAHYVEPALGMYQPEMAGAAAIELLDAQADAMAEAMIAGALGGPMPQLLGPGMGTYQPEMAGAAFEVGNPYGGMAGLYG